MGLFDIPWIGIRHTNKIAMFFDIPHLIIQAGLKPFPSETGKSLVQLGPIMNNGLLFEEQNLTDKKNTLEINE